MKRVALVVVCLALAAADAPAGRTASTAALRSREHLLVARVERAKTTLRWFEHHPRLLCAGKAPRCSSPRVKARAWHAVAVARETIIRGRAELAAIRAAIERAAVPSHYREWLCIQSHETPPPFPAWRTSSGNGYYGGLQMDRGFMGDHGLDVYREKGTADHWTPAEQMMVAERAHDGVYTRLRGGRVVLVRDEPRGFHPWPNTARACGLI